ncbi:hypothetical protein O1611_g8068 [Lasiodiplodia mahajangana]|uniref:Uncharacterized protein n=1 Tax=Lasiodiplodia mahajangana TaxID=1108764 RepID=A0ACC2JDM1_9PEZI|nr:hypothetical protein O1611_g8068 [Lasiodiplodia mahajangana]
MGYPTPSQRGVITGIYYLGTWASYIFISHPASDRMGRRYAALTGITIVAVGTAFESGASGPGAYSMMIAGRIISGIGTGLVSTSVPLYQRFGYPFIVFKTRLPRWPIPYLYITYPALTCVLHKEEKPSREIRRPESRRIRHRTSSRVLGRVCRDVLEQHGIRRVGIVAVLAGHQPDPERSVRRRAAISPGNCSLVAARRELHERADPPRALAHLRRRRGVPGLRHELAHAVQRREPVQPAVEGVSSAVHGADVYPQNRHDSHRNATHRSPGTTNHARLRHARDGNRAVVCIFVYALGYSMGFGPAAWVYGSEIFPTAVRARGLNFSASGSSVGSIVAAQVWPVGIEEIGSNIYFFFMAINFICIPIILLFYPETKGVSLEDMDLLFKHHQQPSAEDVVTDDPVTITTIDSGLPKSPVLAAR